MFSFPLEEREGADDIHESFDFYLFILLYHYYGITVAACEAMQPF